MADRLTEIEAFIDGSLVEPGDVRFLLARVRELETALRKRDELIAVQVAYQRGEAENGVAVWEWPAALAPAEEQ